VSEIPDNGTWSRRLRRWNIQHGYSVSIAFWLAVLAAAYFWLSR